MKYLVLVGLLLLAGCTKTSLVPVWRITPKEVYPASDYLVAIGEGDTRQAAERNAAAALSRMVESNMPPPSADFGLVPDTALLNIQFGEPFIDINRRVHIAGFVSRGETAVAYKKKIAEHAAEILQLTDHSDRAGEPLKKYALRRAAARLALQNNLWIGQLGFIHPAAGKKIVLPYDPASLYKETKRLGHSVTFEIDLKGSASGVTEDVLESELTAIGFSKKRSRPVLSFSGTAAFSETDLIRESLVFMRYKIKVEARNQRDKPVLFLEKSSRAGHLTLDEAKKRAERMLRADLPILTRIGISNLFDRLVEEERSSLILFPNPPGAATER